MTQTAVSARVTVPTSSVDAVTDVLRTSTTSPHAVSVIITRLLYIYTYCLVDVHKDDLYTVRGRVPVWAERAQGANFERFIHVIESLY